MSFLNGFPRYTNTLLFELLPCECWTKVRIPFLYPFHNFISLLKGYSFGIRLPSLFGDKPL